MELNAEMFEDFWDELPTNACGENGCDSCAIAYHRSCGPIFAGPAEPAKVDGVVHVDASWEGDTELDIRPVFLDDHEYAELGGEG